MSFKETRRWTPLGAGWAQTLPPSMETERGGRQGRLAVLLLLRGLRGEAALPAWRPQDSRGFRVGAMTEELL